MAPAVSGNDPMLKDGCWLPTAAARFAESSPGRKSDNMPKASHPSFFSPLIAILLFK